jgi:hypothetical protein
MIGFIQQPQRRPIRGECGQVVAYLAQRQNKTVILSPTGELVANVLRWKRDPVYRTGLTGGTFAPNVYM